MFAKHAFVLLFSTLRFVQSSTILPKYLKIVRCCSNSTILQTFAQCYWNVCNFVEIWTCSKFEQLCSNLYKFAEICTTFLKFVHLCSNLYSFAQICTTLLKICLYLSQICTTLLKFIQFNSLQRKRSCLLCRNINDGCESFTTLNAGQQLPHRQPHLHEDLLRQQPGHQAARIWRPVQHQDAAQARRPGQPGANVIKILRL